MTRPRTLLDPLRYTLNSNLDFHHNYSFSSVLVYDFHDSMMAMLDKYGRVALDVASAGSSLGFAAARAGTSLGVRAILRNLSIEC